MANNNYSLFLKIRVLT